MTADPVAGPAAVDLVSSTRLEVLDVYGMPYEVALERSGPLDRLSTSSGRQVVWPSGDGVAGWTSLEGIPVFAPVVPDERIGALLGAGSSDWEACAVIRDPSGARVSSVRRSGDGSVFLPFDPNRAALALLGEEYLELTSSGTARLAKSVARRAYYRVRPLLPRRTQLALRRRFAEVQQRSAFPDWPAETALHDLREWVLGVVEQVAGAPLPQMAWWPGDATWAVVLTHDVERASGYAIVDEIVEIERREGLRAAWYFVPERDYRVDDALVERLRADGLEICLHGLRHDGRDLQPGTFDKRLPTMQEYARRWQATGFRAPSTQRSREFVARLGLDHDSSYSDVARFEPQGGGSCSWLPFFIDDVVELPITMPMDHTLFELLGHRDESVWVDKADVLRERGGMALLLTHPDYLLQPPARTSYASFLARVARDETAWHALPREVSDWWRRRAASHLRRDVSGWVVEGPAATEGRVVTVDRPSPFPPPSTGSDGPASGDG